MDMALVPAIPAAAADADLVRRVAARDEQAFQALYATYGQRLYAYALRLTGQAAVAEEVLQESLAAAWQAAHRFRGESRVLTWLLGIVHHQALNMLRRQRHWPHDSLDDVAEPIDDLPGPDEQAVADGRRQALQKALASLTREHRAVLELVFYQGLSLAEVAQVSGCPLGTVKSRLSYAKTRLRAALAQAGIQAVVL